jgi:hypothetical protein
MKTIRYVLLLFERNKRGKVFLMVVTEPGASLLQSFTVEVELNIKRRKTVLNGVKCCKTGFDGKIENLKLSENAKL